MGRDHFRFAHMADLHLGSFNADPFLRDLELKAVEVTMTICLEKGVDFVIISGDLFDSNIPDLNTVVESIKSFMRVRDKEIPIYVIPGSHDFTVGQTGILDVLTSSRVFTRVTAGDVEDGALKLHFVEDPRTGAKVTGLAGRIRGREVANYEILDRTSLEKEPGFKIFAFHSAITEYKPPIFKDTESIALSLLPRNFSYYAGGHVHKRVDVPDRNLYYPGPLVGGEYRDLEMTATGEERGFFIVDVTQSGSTWQQKVDFIPLHLYESEFKEFDVKGRPAGEVNSEILRYCDQANVDNKVMLLRVYGELSSGKTSDINWNLIYAKLHERGASLVRINRHSLRSQEILPTHGDWHSVDEIEAQVFQESIGKLGVKNPNLTGTKGTKLAGDILKTFKTPRKPNEIKESYNDRIQERAKETLGISELIKDFDGGEG